MVKILIISENAYMLISLSYGQIVDKVTLFK